MKTEERIKRILGSREDSEARFIEPYDEVIEIVNCLRAVGYLIVFTSGVWDLKHVGHEKYLIAGRNLGDILIVGCDTDELTRRKGPHRPIVPMMERVEQLINLRSVSIVVPISSFEEADKLIASMKPDVLLLSISTEENKPKHVLEMEEKHKNNCGKIIALPPQGITSTTARVRMLMFSGISAFKEKVLKALDDLYTEFKKGGESS
jgi:D-beta-D-heptose 7-phosphate kinase/D-beta-D-heptose 1-phosphate adenosyltransferase